MPNRRNGAKWKEEESQFNSKPKTIPLFSNNNNMSTTPRATTSTQQVPGAPMKKKPDPQDPIYAAFELLEEIHALKIFCLPVQQQQMLAYLKTNTPDCKTLINFLESQERCREVLEVLGKFYKQRNFASDFDCFIHHFDVPADVVIDVPHKVNIIKWCMVQMYNCDYHFNEDGDMEPIDRLNW